MRTHVAIAAAAAVCLVAPATATATPLFAAPNGDDMGGTNPCTNSMAPCTIDRAVEVVAVPGDDVSLAPGTYTLNDNLLISGADPDIVVHGAPGARPTLLFASPMSIGVTAGGTLRDVNVTDSANVSELLAVENNAEVVERVFVHADDGGRSCEVSGTLRDSVCWTEGGGIPALRTSAGPGVSIAGILRNVTAINPDPLGYGIEAFGGGAMARAEIFGSNVIARAGLFDVRAEATHIANVVLDHSNYATQEEAGTGAVTDPNTNDNQMTAPLFVDAANGDFRQTAASTGTIDLGTASVTLGPLDLYGDPRISGSAPDIGADEFVPPAAPAGTVTPVVNPVVQPTPPKCKKKKRKKGKKRKKRRCPR